jgi:tRNA-2-methylthio-N6-dimethylallyladenosine synthase
MNVRDSEIVRGILEECKYQFVDDESHADIVIFNTCSVREHAEHRAISVLGSFIKKDKKHKKIFALIGCVAEYKKESLFRRLPDLDIIAGPADIYSLPELILQALNNKTNIAALSRNRQPRSLKNINPYYRSSKTHAFVNISYGCDNFCSYCVVPYVRGREVSRPLGDIVEEICGLLERGIREITLLGQNVNSYKSADNIDFVGLLKKVNTISGIKKISFVTSHPKDVSKQLFEAMRDLDKVDKHLHLPFQSGSDRILKLMNRGYTKRKYLTLAEDYKKTVGGTLSTDVIVGFPTETEEDFFHTKDVLEKVNFRNAYIFKYSSRPGTKAYALDDDVTKDVKEKRHNILLDLQKKISLAYK